MIRPLVALITLIAATPASGGVVDAVRYLESHRTGDGCYAEAGGQADPKLTAWVVLGLAAQHQPTASGASCLEARSATLRTWEELTLGILALDAAGRNPRDAGGVDLVGRLGDLRGADRIGPTVNSHIFGILALRAVRARVPRAYLQTLRRDQRPDGSYAWAGGVPGDSNMTAAALWALRATGHRPRGTVTVRARRALLRFRTRQRGYALYRGGKADAQSTAWASMTIGGYGGRTRLLRRFILRLQAPDGSIRYRPGDAATPVFVTAQALGGLAARPLPY